jgi:DNA-binding IclR family transcriptional regulator
LYDGTASRKTAATVDRALDVLELLKAAPEPMGVRELARRLAVSPATVHRLLASLAARGFVGQVDGSRAYRLGWALLDYANSLVKRTDLVEIGGPLARELRDRLGETVTLQVPVGHDRVCLLEAEGIHEIRRRVGVGRRVPLYAGASGRAILAFMPPADVELIMTNATARADRTKSVAELRVTLAESRMTGIAISEGETVEGVGSIATPLFNAAGTVVGSLAVSGPSSRCAPDVLAGYADELLLAGLELSRRLGFGGRVAWHVNGAEAPRAAISGARASL